MSFGMVIQTPNDIVMGADTAVSVTLNKELYRLHEEGVKLFIIGDMLIYCSGVMRVAKKCMEELDESKEKTVNKLKDILSFSFNQYLAQNKEAKERYEKDEDLIISAMVAQNKNGKPHFYTLEPKDGFAIKENSPPEKGGMYIATDGIKTEESYEYVTNYVSEKMRLEGTVNTEEVFQRAYDHMSFEGIGGVLTLVHLNKEGVRVIYQNPIKENSDMKRFTPTGITAAAIKAGTMTSVESTIGTGNNIFKATSQGIQLGHTLFSSSPFSVDMTGYLRATNANITGVVNATSGNFSGDITVTGKITGGSFVGNAISNGTIVGSSINIGNGAFTVNTAGAVNCSNLTLTGGSINWANMNAPSAAQVGALPSNTYIPSVPAYITATKITKTDIESPTIRGGKLIGGTVESDTQITVGTNLFVGDTIYLNQGFGSTQSIISKGNGNIDFTSSGMTIASFQKINFSSGQVTYNGDEIATRSWVQTNAVARFG